MKSNERFQEVAKQAEVIVDSAAKEFKKLRDAIAQNSHQLYEDGNQSRGMSGVFSTYCLYLASAIIDFAYRNLLANAGQETANCWLAEALDASSKMLSVPGDAVIKRMDISLAVKGLDDDKP